METYCLLPGVRLHCFPDRRFKQELLSIQLVSPMKKETAALNSLIPAVLLRGCKSAPDMRQITLKLDDLYGAGVGAVGRRVGDYQVTGLSCHFLADRFAFAGDRVLANTVSFLRELLLEPVLEKGVFRADYVESEKKNLLSYIESQRNDKRAYCQDRLLEKLCARDSYGIPRLGTPEQVRAITPEGLYDQYRTLLKTARAEIYYVGSFDPEKLRALLVDFFPDRCYVNLPEQTHLVPVGGGEHEEIMDIAQGKLCMGFVTPVEHNQKDYFAMQVCNTLFGGGMTSKLFMQVREKQSLCYDISSAYKGGKGILTVSAGIDWTRAEAVKQEVLGQLEAICRGEFTREELTAAKQALISALQGVPDSPHSLVSYYGIGNLKQNAISVKAHEEAVAQVTGEQVAAVAKTLTLDTVYLLRGGAEE